jgi:small neutral amino acid transporter SnatA (MarC family)
MLMGSRDPSQLGVWAAALTGAMVVSTLVLLAADPLQRLLGERAVRAFERLMGLVLTAVAVEMLLDGIKSIAAQFRG